MKIEIKGKFARLVEDSSLIQNSKKPYTVEFIFSEDWTGYAKTALFEAGGSSIAVALTEDSCNIPSECLKRAGVKLKIAVHGVKGDEHKSTVWCVTSMILYDTNFGKGQSTPPTPLPDDAYTEIMSTIGDLSAAGFEGKTLVEAIVEIKQSISETASDEEVDDALNDAFGPDSGLPGNPEEEAPGNTATDKEVDDILNEVYGPEDEP